MTRRDGTNSRYINAARLDMIEPQSTSYKLNRK
jgi:hypothetical protein